MTPEEEQEFEFRLRLEQEQASTKPDPLARANKFSLSGDVSKAGRMEQFAGGAKHSLDRAAYGLKGLFTDLSNEDKEQLAAGREFVANTGGWSTGGEFVGDAAITAPIGGAFLKGGSLLGKALAARGIGQTAGKQALGRTANVVGSAATTGALVSPEDRETGAALGAAGGGAGVILQRALGGLVKPLTTAASRLLMKEGVQPTALQSLGPNASRFEQRLESFPLAGDFVTNARKRALEDFNRAAVKEAGGTGKEFGDEALGTLRSTIGSKFDAALDKATGPVNFQKEMVDELIMDPALMLSNESQEKVSKLIWRNVMERNGNLSPQVAKRIESDLSRTIARYRGGNSTGEERAIAEALQRVQTHMREAIGRSMPDPADRQLLDEATQQWRAFIPVDKAASTAGAQAHGGTFTPRALRRALESQDLSQHNNVSRAASIGDELPTPFPRTQAPQAPNPVPGAPPGVAATTNLLRSGPSGQLVPTGSGSAVGPVRPTAASGSVPPVAAPGRQYPRSVGDPGSPHNRLNVLGRAGEQVLDATVPDSGTAGRMGIGLGMLMAPMTVGLGTIGAMGGYSKFAQRALTQGLAPDAVDKMIKVAALRGIPEDQLMNLAPSAGAALLRSGE